MRKGRLSEGDFSKKSDVITMQKVSVVIPLYNKELHIKRAIRSVLVQSIQNFEVIVVDDGSTDDSPEVVKGFKDPRIHLIQQENAGVSAARNKGIQESQTDFITFLDADDEWMPNFLETILRLREKYPKAGAYTTAYLMCTANGQLVKPDYKAIPPAPWEGLLPNFFRVVSRTDHPFSASTMGIPKRVFFEIGRFSVGVWRGEDKDMWGRIALKYLIAFSWNVGAIYHLDAADRACNKTGSIQELPFVKIANQSIKNGEIPSYIINDLKRYISNIEFYFALCNLKAGNYKLSRILFAKCETKYFIYNLLRYNFLVLRKQLYVLYKYLYAKKKRIFLEKN